MFSEYSRILVPRPPQKSTTFIPLFLFVLQRHHGNAIVAGRFFAIWGRRIVSKISTTELMVKTNLFVRLRHRAPPFGIRNVEAFLAFRSA